MRFSSFLPAVLVGAAVAAPVVDEDLMRRDREAAAEIDLLRRQIPSKTCSHITGGLHLLVLGGANSDNVSHDHSFDTSG